MPSSHNIIKSHQWKSDETTSSIDTKLSLSQKAECFWIRRVDQVVCLYKLVIL